MWLSSISSPPPCCLQNACGRLSNACHMQSSIAPCCIPQRRRLLYLSSSLRYTKSWPRIRDLLKHGGQLEPETPFGMTEACQKDASWCLDGSEACWKGWAGYPQDKRILRATVAFCLAFVVRCYHTCPVVTRSQMIHRLQEVSTLAVEVYHISLSPKPPVKAEIPCHGMGPQLK